MTEQDASMILFVQKCVKEDAKTLFDRFNINPAKRSRLEGSVAQYLRASYSIHQYRLDGEKTHAFQVRLFHAADATQLRIYLDQLLVIVEAQKLPVIFIAVEDKDLLALLLQRGYTNVGASRGFGLDLGKLAKKV